MRRSQVEKAIDEFFTRYDNTLSLLQEFLASKSNRQEFVLLSCARLDSLANLAFAEGTQKSRFSRFLAKYSGLGKQTFTISVPDLNYYFQHYFWISAANVPEPGRMLLFRSGDRAKGVSKKRPSSQISYAARRGRPVLNHGREAQ